MKLRGMMTAWAVAGVAAFGGMTATAPVASAAPALPSSAAAYCWKPTLASVEEYNLAAHAEGSTVSHSGPHSDCASYTVPVAWVYSACKYTNTAGNVWYYTDWGWIYGAKYLSFPNGSETRLCHT